VSARLRQGDLHNRRPVTANAGVAVHPLAHPQRRLRKVVQAAPGEAVFDAVTERLPELPANLLVADDHRVQAAGHPERVTHRGVLVVHVQVLGQFFTC